MEFDGNIPIANELKQLANELYKNQKYSEAIDLYSQCINLFPETSTFYLNRSAAYMMTGDFKRAIADSRKCLSLDPMAAKAYFRIAKCFMNLGNVNESISQLNFAKSAISPRSHPSASQQFTRELYTCNKIKQNIERFEGFFEKGLFNDALTALEICCVLVDPELKDKRIQVAGTYI